MFHSNIDRPVGMVPAEQFWAAIADCGWEIDGDFERITQELPEICERRGITKSELKGFVDRLAENTEQVGWEAAEARGDTEISNDRMNDTAYHIIAMGLDAMCDHNRNPEKILHLYDNWESDRGSRGGLGCTKWTILGRRSPAIATGHPTAGQAPMNTTLWVVARPRLKMSIAARNRRRS